jgi:hypothetical protein
MRSGRSARLVRCPSDVRAVDLVGALGLQAGGPVVVVNGSTTSAAAQRPSGTLADAMGVVAVVAVDESATLVTGGTDAGVFAVLGDALQQAGGGYVCVGVVPSGTTTWPGRSAAAEMPDTDGVALEAHHTHFVVVDGADWGDETSVMLAVASELAGSHPSVAVLAGGGAIAADELAGHLHAGRPVVVLAGSGRLADEVARAVGSGATLRWPAETVVADGDLIDVVEVGDASSVLPARLRHHLASKEV